MELFNKGDRTIDGLKPQTSAVFDNETAERLLGLYGHELVKASEAKVIASDEDIQAYVDKVEDENKLLLAEKGALEVENKQLKEGDKVKLKGQVKDLQEELGKAKLELTDALTEIETLKAEIAKNAEAGTDEPSFPE